MFNCNSYQRPPILYINISHIVLLKKYIARPSKESGCCEITRFLKQFVNWTIFYCIYYMQYAFNLFISHVSLTFVT